MPSFELEINPNVFEIIDNKYSVKISKAENNCLSIIKGKLVVNDPSSDTNVKVNTCGNSIERPNDNSNIQTFKCNDTVSRKSDIQNIISRLNI